MTKDVVQVYSKEDILKLTPIQLLDRRVQRDVNYSLSKNDAMFPPVFPCNGKFLPNKLYAFRINDKRFGYYFEKDFPDNNPIDLLAHEHCILVSGIFYDAKPEQKDYDKLAKKRLVQQGVDLESMNWMDKDILITNYVRENRNVLEAMLLKDMPEKVFNKVLHRFSIKTGLVDRLVMKDKPDWKRVSGLAYRFA